MSITSNNPCVGTGLTRALSGTFFTSPNIYKRLGPDRSIKNVHNL